MEPLRAKSKYLILPPVALNTFSNMIGPIVNHKLGPDWCSMRSSVHSVKLRVHRHYFAVGRTVHGGNVWCLPPLSAARRFGRPIVGQEEGRRRWWKGRLDSHRSPVLRLQISVNCVAHLCVIADHIIVTFDKTVIFLCFRGNLPPTASPTSS